MNHFDNITHYELNDDKFMDYQLIKEYSFDILTILQNLETPNQNYSIDI